MSQSTEAQFQAARAAQNDPATPPQQPVGQQPSAQYFPAPPEAAKPEGTKGGRPSTLMLAGAGSILAVLAFLGGMAVGHSWDGTSNQQGQFGDPGGGFRGGFPQGNGQGNGQGTGLGQGTLPNQSQGGTQQGQGTGTQQIPGQPRTS